MLALSPPLFCTNYGWPLEELITQNIEQDCNYEANSYHSLLDLPTYDQVLPQDFTPQISISSEGAENGLGDIGDTKKVAKKIDHNASERDRRKRVNNLYAFLSSLLPLSTDQKKKVSVPGIVSQALKYIPDLEKEVNTLKNKKEKLLSYSSSTDIRNNQTAKAATIRRTSSVVSSVSVLNDKAAVIQLIFSSDFLKKNNGIGLLSIAVEYLEEEEGLLLLNTITFECPGEERWLNTLHFQVQDDHKLAEPEKLKEKLCSLYRATIT